MYATVSRSLRRRTWGLSFLALAGGLIACGGQTSGPPVPPGPGSSCSSCASYQLCSPTTNSCVLDRSSSWFFSVSDAALDTPRDSYFVLDGHKSSIQKGTQYPAWGEGGVYTAGQLIDTGVAIEFFNSGTFVDTSLSQPRKLLLSESDFTGAPLTVTNWDKVSEVHFNLTAR